eukprot:TRINITY_DN6400_c0_g1_i4.p1 TRINITY_DN6400_c0_g1~~TRINITY_DN6400_c0_g1_i4.p1  ORF type:complete len:325 (-),score=44.23 TRINITY_DN6400_c0_g1_i4:643-1617(-)
MSEEKDEEQTYHDNEKPNLEIPDHRKYRESLDFTITKTVIEEGDLDSWQPRFASSGTVVFEIVGPRGSSLEQVQSDETLTKYLASSPCDFVIGSAETELDRQLERCFQMMYLNEHSQFNVRVLLEPNLNGGVGKLAGSEGKEPEWINLEISLKLESLLNADPIYKWFNETKLNKALEFHASGVRLFKEKRYLDSFHMFKTAYKLSVLARGLPSDNYEDVDKAQNLMNLCCNNLAACHFQWKNNHSVIDLSDKVLESQPDNVKTLYRKSVANAALQEYDKAELDLIKAKKLEPNNRAVNDELGRVQHLKKTAEAKLAKQMSKMFG